MLTKNDLRAIKQLVDEAINSALKDRPTKNDLVGLAKGVEIDELKIEFRDRLERWKHELYNKIDPILNRVKTAEDENVILQSREDAREEIKKEIDNRLDKLESIHPNGRHQFP